MKKKFLAAAIGAMLIGGSATAVVKSHDGVGDVLIAPGYLTTKGYSTDIKVVNTSLTKSVVAKVVFRDPIQSNETLDFLIYLSPSDVWKARVTCATFDAAGVCTKSTVVSADDSMLNENSDVFGTTAVPAVITSDNLTSAATNRQALPSAGYFEIFESVALDVAPNKPGVLKSNILAAYNAHGVVICQPENPVCLASETANVLTGSVTINTHTGFDAAQPVAQKATLPMVALESYKNTQKLLVGVLTGFDNPVGTATVADVEEALWVNNVVLPYDFSNGTTIALFNFPTKLTYDLKRNGQFSFASQTCVEADVYDNLENSILGLTYNVSPLPKINPACLNEFHALQVGGAGAAITTGSYTEGWARVRFQGAAPAVAQTVTPGHSVNTGRLGVPAIVSYLTTAPFAWTYAASAR